MAEAIKCNQPKQSTEAISQSFFLTQKQVKLNDKIFKNSSKKHSKICKILKFANSNFCRNNKSNSKFGKVEKIRSVV